PVPYPTHRPPLPPSLLRTPRLLAFAQPPRPAPWTHHLAAPPPLLANLLNAPSQLLSHHLVARLLHRREVARGLPVLVTLDLRQSGPVAVPCIHQPPHAV